MRGSEEFAIILIFMAVLGMPVVALVLAIVALVRAGHLRRTVQELQRQIAELGGAPGPRVQPQQEPAAPRRAAVPAAPAPPPVAPTAGVAPAPLPAAPVAPAATTAPDRPPPPPVPPKAEGPGLEARLGARLTVWIGAVALILAGAFLVKYSFDQGLLSPPVRVLLGVVFGMVFLAAGEVLRRRAPFVSQGFSAAGVADLYASFLAAVNLYHLMSPLAGFGLMALTTAVAVALSLRQGVIIAVLGLVGGFFTPYWIHTGDPRPGPLFAYLLLLQVGLLVATRKRRWWWLSGLTLAAGVVWVAAWLALVFRPEHALWLGFFILASVAAFLASGFVGRAAEAWGGTTVPTGLSWASVGAGVVLMAALVGANHFGSVEWAFLGILGAAALVLGRLEPSLEGLPWLAAAVTAGMLLAWGGDLSAGDVRRYLVTALALGALFAAAAYAAAWGAVKPHRWAALSAVSSLAFFLAAYQGERLAGGTGHWGAPALLLAVLYMAFAAPVLRRRDTLPDADLTLAALAVGVTAFVSLAVPVELERQWLAVAWALEVPALVWLAARLRVPALRHLAWPLAGLVAVRLLLNPEVLTYPIGTTPVWNWLLYGYGLPILAFAGAAWLAGEADRSLSRALQWGALLLATAFLALEVRQYFHPLHLAEWKSFLGEWGALSIAWMALGVGLLFASRRWPLTSLDWGGRALVGLALAQCALTQVLADNPLWTHHPVGATPALNALLWVYGGPALLVLVAAWELDRRGEVVLPRLFGLAGLALAFLLLTLEVRQAFQGTYLDGRALSNPEKYAYSIAWVLFGTALLVAGILRRWTVLRYASLVVMLLTVGKVFLYDMAQLKDLYRVLSFLGLGLSLFLLAFLYQRFVLGSGRT